MLGASGFFTFKHLIFQGAGPKRTYAFAYKPPGKLQPGVLDQLIVESCRGPLIPDVLVVMGLKGDTRNELSRHLKAKELRLSRSRIEGRIPLVLALYDLTTGLVEIEVLDTVFADQLERFQSHITAAIQDWLRSGLQAVFPPDDVILRAPPGYTYQKPSGSRSEIFLKPDLGPQVVGKRRLCRSGALPPCVRGPSRILRVAADGIRRHDGRLTRGLRPAGPAGPRRF